MRNHEVALKSLLEAEADTICYGFVARSTGEIVAEAGSRSLLPETVVSTSLRHEFIVSRYEECERQLHQEQCNRVPRGYARDRVSAVIGIPCPDVLLVLFGQMPQHVVAATGDFSARVAWYWSHRRLVWERVKAEYTAADVRLPVGGGL